MNRNIQIVCVLIIFAIIQPKAFSQNWMHGISYIKTYTAEDYKAHKQTWSATQDGRGIMYFADSHGVLEYDGSSWRLIKINNRNLVVRALFTDKNGRVYVGCAGTFGYLAPDKIGKMVYIPLVDKISDENYKKFIGISSIFEVNNKIYFAGDNVIFEYEKNNVKAYPIEGLRQIHEANGRIFMRISKKGLYEFIDGKVQLLPSGENYKNIGFMNVLSYSDGDLIIVSSGGLLLYDNHTIYEFKTKADDFLKKHIVVSAKLIADDVLALGTFSGGLLIINLDGNVLQHIDVNSGLKDNLISNIYKDLDDNIWLTGNSISYVLTSIPLCKFNESNGLQSTTYTSIEKDDKLYIGTTTGLYCKKWNTANNNMNDSITIFKQIGMPFNVWSLDTIKGSLLAATNLGISELINDKLINVIDNVGVWKFLRLNGEPNLLIAATNENLIMLEYNKAKQKTENNWHFKHKIKGFSGKCRHSIIDKSNNIWIQKSTKIISKLSLTESLDSVITKEYNKDNGLRAQEQSYMFYINDKVLLGTIDGIYEYEPQNDTFIKSNMFDSLFTKDVQILSMLEDIDGDIYYKQIRKISDDKNIYELGKLIHQNDGTYKDDKIPYSRLRNSIYSLNLLSHKKLLIGALKGFVLFQPNSKVYEKPYNTIIRSVELFSNDSLIFLGASADSAGLASIDNNLEHPKIIDFEFNDIGFTFSSPFFDGNEKTLYKFFLEGNDKSWSEWKPKNQKDYSNLSEGKYVFRVKAKNIYEQESKEAVYCFRILPPWYRTVWAMLIYLLLVLFVVWGIVRLSVRRLRKQKEYLEQVVKERTAEIRLKNDELAAKNETIENKNKSITASITYAKRIQDAMLPLLGRIESELEDYFILFKPRDIVSGDFYWYAEINNKIIFTAVDCTGHGVPGAFMSMIGSEILASIVNKGITRPSEILEKMDLDVKKALKQDKTENHDGMDMSLCTIDKENKTVEWAGAKNPLLYIKNDELFYIKANSRSIGGYQVFEEMGSKDFTNHVISYSDAPTSFYVFSDGFQDQFGGPKGRKYMIKRLKNLIYDNYKKTMQEQNQIYNNEIQNWMATEEQTDDILLIGFRLSP